MDSPFSEESKNALTIARDFYIAGNFKASLVECRRAEAAGLESPELAVRQASALLSLKRYSEAERFIMEKLEKYPGEDGLYYNLIVFKLKKWKLKEAEVLLGYAKSKCGWTGRLAAANTLILLRKFRFIDAITFAEAELKQFPDEAILHLNLGQGYRGIWKSRESKAEFKRAVELDAAAAVALIAMKRRQMALFGLIPFLAIFLLVALFSFYVSPFIAASYFIFIAAFLSIGSTILIKNRKPISFWNVTFGTLLLIVFLDTTIRLVYLFK